MSALAEAIRTQPRTTRLAALPWTPLLRWGSLAVAALALLVGAALGEPQAIVTAALTLAVGLAIVWIGFRARPDERAFLLTVFLVAFGLRVAVAVASHFALLHLGRGGFLLLDDRAYDKLGWTLARVWMGIFPGIRDTDQYLMVNYTYLVAAVYYVLGHSLLAAKMLNVAFGALLGVAVYALADEIFGRRTAQIAALLAAFFPSLITWSVINLKDILVVLLTVVAIYGLIRYARRHEWWALGLCLLSFAAIENLRQFIFFILAWLMPIAFLFTDRSDGEDGWRRTAVSVALGLLVAVPAGLYFWNAEGLRSYLVVLPLVFFLPAAAMFARRPSTRRKLALLLPLLAGIMLLSLITNNEKLGTNFLTPKALTEAEWKRWLEESKADTGIGEFGGVKPPKEMDTIGRRTIEALPRGVFYVLLGPTPWEARSAMARAVIPEMLLWYGLLVAALVGLLVAFRKHWRDLVLPLAFAGGWIVALALTEGNTGNIFRHRSQFMPFVFLLSAVGLSWLWARWIAGRRERDRLADR